MNERKMTKEEWDKHFEVRELLEDFCIFAMDEGYLDSDWYAEHPLLIDRFIDDMRNIDPDIPVD